MKFILLCEVDPAERAQVSGAVPRQMQQGMEAFNKKQIATEVLQAAGQLAISHEFLRGPPIAEMLNGTHKLALDGESEIGICCVLEMEGESHARARVAQCPPALAAP